MLHLLSEKKILKMKLFVKHFQKTIFYSLTIFCKFELKKHKQPMFLKIHLPRTAKNSNSAESYIMLI